MMKRLFLIYITLLISVFSVFASDTIKEDSIYVMLEEINITAIKQNNELNREPEASTVLSNEEIERLGILTMRGVSDVVPNFYMPDYGSRITSTIYVRGIGSRMDHPAVGLNVDNVPYLNKDAYDFDISDIASVVMLRGPQSTLYGRNTMGGVINITTLSPVDFQGTRLFVEYGSGTRIKANLGWYHKFTDKIAFSITGDYGHLAGFYANEYNGQKTGKENNFGLRTKLVLSPIERLTIQNVLGATFLRQGGYPYEYVGSGMIAYNDTCFYRRFTITEGLTLGYRHDKFDLTSITSVQHIDDNMTLDQDFLPDSYFTLSQIKKETAATEEIVFRGEELSDKYKWLAGAMFFTKHLDMDAPVTFKDVGIKSLIEDHRNQANLNYPIKWDNRQFVLNSLFTIPTTGFALYHESNFNLGNWEIQGGIRFDYEYAVLNYRSFTNTGYEIYHLEAGEYLPYHHVDIDIDDTGKLKKDFFSVLPKIAVSYTLPSTMGNIYAKVAKGYKAGGFNTQMFSDVLQQRLMNIMGIGSKYDVDDIVAYKPENSWNYEIGSHLFFPGIGLDAELTLFYIHCTDQQLTMFPDGNTTGRIMTNAGKTRSYGIEVTTRFKKIKNLELNISYGYTNAKFIEFHNGIDDFSGKYLPYVPSNTFFTQALYKLNLNRYRKMGLVFDINLRGTGSIYWNEENTLKQDFYAQLGASVGFNWETCEFKLWGRNLTDTDYHTFYFKSMGNEFLQRGRPIEIGASVRWSF